jgi:hypothetical protein
LTCISFIFHDVFSALVYNKCSDFELVSPVYFGRDVIWHIPPDQKVDTNTMTSASFGKHVLKHEFMVALIYRLQRKNIESNMDHTKDTSTSIQLLVIWRFNNSYDFNVNTMLIKHNDTITWDEDKLRALYSMHRDLSRTVYRTKDVWLLDEATVLMTTSKWGEERYTTKITLSEGTRDDSFTRPIRVYQRPECDW